MFVNIKVIDADMNWIAGRLARELSARLPKYGIKAAINSRTATFDYHQIVYGEPERRPAIGMFTHGKDRPLKFGPSYDGQISLNPAMHDYLVESCGIESPVIIELPVDDCYIKKNFIFGVSGRVYGDGRKGEHLVKHMVEAGYTVSAWGHGWPCEVVSSKVEDLPAFYKGLDYYVDTSSDEGGCTPALECAAMGIPVISHILGITKPVIPYETHDWESLSKVLYKLTHPQTYDKWVEEHAKYFQKIISRLESVA